MENRTHHNWVLLGASRGLGKAFEIQVVKSFSESQVFVASRKSKWSVDFTCKEDWSKIFEEILQKKPHRIIYFAGGGPYGNYTDKLWKDHEWAWKLNFEFPAWLAHSLGRAKLEQFQQLCLVGSSIAESKPDPGAVSYSAGKHALLGFVKSLQAEASLPFDLRLFSPGYMDTNMLPANAWPRQKPGLIQSPDKVASELLAWLLDDSKMNTHLVKASVN